MKHGPGKGNQKMQKSPTAALVDMYYRPTRGHFIGLNVLQLAILEHARMVLTQLRARADNQTPGRRVHHHCHVASHATSIVQESRFRNGAPPSKTSSH